MENETDNDLPAVDYELLERIKHYFFSEYYPVQKFTRGVLFMSTDDIYNLFFNLYPNALAFTTANVAEWMHEKGYHFIKMGELKYEWMLMPGKF